MGDTIVTGVRGKETQIEESSEEAWRMLALCAQEPDPHPRPTVLKTLCPSPGDSENPDTFSALRCEAVRPTENGPEPGWSGSLLPQPHSVSPGIC